MQDFILFAFSSGTFAFDFGGENVEKTVSFSLIWKAEIIKSQPIRIHRKQYKYLGDHFRGTNK